MSLKQQLFSFVFLGYAGLMSCAEISSVLLHFLRLSIWSFDHWLPRGDEIMLYWFRCRFHWRSTPDSHWLSKFLTMYWFLPWLCVGKKICREKLGCMNTQCCPMLDRWESHHDASKMNWAQLSLTGITCKMYQWMTLCSVFSMLMVDETL